MFALETYYQSVAVVTRVIVGRHLNPPDANFPLRHSHINPVLRKFWVRLEHLYNILM